MSSLLNHILPFCTHYPPQWMSGTHVHFFSECISLLLLVYLAMKSVTRLLTSHGEELTHRASSQPILKYFHLLQWQ